jgi:N-acyl-D-amino-acid deacylase
MKNKFSKIKRLRLINCRIPHFDDHCFVNTDIGIDGPVVSPQVLNDKHAQTIDARGMIVSPGFIDIHSHGDSAVFHSSNPKTFQGVTAEVTGNCGLSAIDFSDDSKSLTDRRTHESELETFRGLYTSVWGDFPENLKYRNIGEYNRQIESGAFTKSCMLMGVSSLRLAVSGLENRPLCPSEMESLERLICLGFEQGSPGISFGMNYVPNTFAQRAEYALASRLAAKYGRKLVFHIRDEGQALLESLEEALAIADLGNAALHISHLKCHGKANWHKRERMLSFFDCASRDHEISFDAQPYTSGSTTLFSLLPPEYFRLSSDMLEKVLSDKEVIRDITEKVKTGIPGWDNYYASTGPENIIPTGLLNPVNSDIKGKSLAQISEIRGISPVKAFCEIILSEAADPKGRNTALGMILNGRDERNVAAVLSHPLAMIGSDALYGPNPHPRTFGAFPRYFQRFIRELKIMPMIDAVERVTKRPAEVMGLNRINRILNRPDIGVLEPGSSSDLVMFDEKRIGHDPDFETDTPERPEGVELVISSGKLYDLRL